DRHAQAQLAEDVEEEPVELDLSHDRAAGAEEGLERLAGEPALAVDVGIVGAELELEGPVDHRRPAVLALHLVLVEEGLRVRLADAAKAKAKEGYDDEGGRRGRGGDERLARPPPASPAKEQVADQRQADEAGGPKFVPQHGEDDHRE